MTKKTQNCWNCGRQKKETKLWCRIWMNASVRLVKIWPRQGEPWVRIDVDNLCALVIAWTLEYGDGES